MLKQVESALSKATDGKTSELRDLIQELRALNIPKKRGRKPRPQDPVAFAQSFKAFKGTKEYAELYSAVQNRTQFTEHLIWLAFRAGFQAKP